MAAGNVRSITFAPGRLIVGPTTAFATTAYPHGGTEIGLSRASILTPLGVPRRIENEALGEPSDVLDAPNAWLFTCLLRGWDDDAVLKFFPGERTAGSVTQHGVFSVPGTRTPGQSSADSINLVVALVPDDLIHANGLVMFRAIPMWDEGAEIAFQKGGEHAIPLSLHCLRNGSDHMLSVGRMPDLGLT